MAIGKKIRIYFRVCIWAFALVVINITAYQYNWRLDLTKAKHHTLSQETKDYIKDLNQDVRLTALYVDIAPRYLEDLFKEYERASAGRIKTKIVDPLVDIGYAAQFGNIITGKQKKVVVQSGIQRRDIDFTEDVLTEELLTNAIIRVTRDKRTICFLAGHREFKVDDEDDHGLFIFDQLLATNNMESRELLLSQTGSVPSDCDVLVVAGAQSHLSKQEEQAINEYLTKGGDALFLIEHVIVTSPDKPLTEEEFNRNPSLNGILNNWGVKVNNDVVVDLDSHAAGDVGSPATNNYLTHRAIVSGLDYTFYVRPRSISIMPQRRESLKVAPIVLTRSSKNAWGETDRTLMVQFDEIIDRPGPVPIAFVIWEAKEEGERSDTRIIVFTDADFLTNLYIGAYSNAQMGLNAVNWLSELDYKVFVNKKTFEVERLDLTSEQKRIILLILILMPLFISLMGIIVWIRKR